MPRRLTALSTLVALGACTAAISGCGSTASAATGHTTRHGSHRTTTRTGGRPVLTTAMVRVNGARRLIVVTGTGRAVYLLTGDTIQHPKCATSECHHVWMPVTAAHPVTRGLRAKVGIWHHSGLDQLTLNGHPLYEFVGDARPGEATGEGIHSFGGVWWVLCPKGNAVTGMAMGHTSSTMTAGSSGSASGTTPAGSAGGYGYGY